MVHIILGPQKSHWVLNIFLPLPQGARFYASVWPQIPGRQHLACLSIRSWEMLFVDSVLHCINRRIMRFLQNSDGLMLSPVDQDWVFWSGWKWPSSIVAFSGILQNRFLFLWKTFVLKCYFKLLVPYLNKETQVKGSRAAE